MFLRHQLWRQSITSFDYVTCHLFIVIIHQSLSKISSIHPLSRSHMTKWLNVNTDNDVYYLIRFFQIHFPRSHPNWPKAILITHQRKRESIGRPNTWTTSHRTCQRKILNWNVPERLKCRTRHEKFRQTKKKMQSHYAFAAWPTDRFNGAINIEWPIMAISILPPRARMLAWFCNEKIWAKTKNCPSKSIRCKRSKSRKKHSFFSKANEVAFHLNSKATTKQ